MSDFSSSTTHKSSTSKRQRLSSLPPPIPSSSSILEPLHPSSSTTTTQSRLTSTRERTPSLQSYHPSTRQQANSSNSQFRDVTSSSSTRRRGVGGGDYYGGGGGEGTLSDTGSRISHRSLNTATSTNHRERGEGEHRYRSTSSGITQRLASSTTSTLPFPGYVESGGGGGDTASESGWSGYSVLSAFPTTNGTNQRRGMMMMTPQEREEERRRKRERRREKEARRMFEQQERNRASQVSMVDADGGGDDGSRTREDPTDSPLRRWTKWLIGSGTKGERWRAIVCSLLAVVLVKWCVGLGGYSGLGVPPLRGDFEAQRHWISLASSSLSSIDSIRIVPFLPKVRLYHPKYPSYTASPQLAGESNTTIESENLSSFTNDQRPQPTLENTTTSGIVPISRWYSHDLSYWGLDYPPLTAYHSYFLGFIARLSPSTAQYVTLRPPTTSHSSILRDWEREMKRLEEGERGEGMKNWMRSTVVVGDLFLWVTAVVWYCWANFGGGSGKNRIGGSGGGVGGGENGKSRDGLGSDRALRRIIVTSLTILLQPALILIDNGHFQYNSLMLALTLWSMNAFQSGHDLVGSILFVASLGFKQMALYYAPGIFAYLLGKCLWLGGRQGINLFLHLGITVAISFVVVFLPFLSPFPAALLQSLTRIFPFSRGLFEDKVANVWCALNVVIKLRDLASVETLARLSLIMTGLAVLPSTAGVVYLSRRLAKNRQSTSSTHPTRSSSTIATSSTTSSSVDLIPTSSEPAPTSHLLPHLLLTSSLSFFLVSFQVHEKSILLPLMPLTLLMGAREKGYGRLDWEWGVLVNNVAVFSMWPLLKKDGLVFAYWTLTLSWNFLIGYNPLKLRSGSFVKLLSITTYSTILILHLLELITNPPPHLPDLFSVLNLTVSAGVFGLTWLWGGKRLGQEGWALGGF